MSKAARSYHAGRHEGHAPEVRNGPHQECRQEGGRGFGYYGGNAGPITGPQVFQAAAPPCLAEKHGGGHGDLAGSLQGLSRTTGGFLQDDFNLTTEIETARAAWESLSKQAGENLPKTELGDDSMEAKADKDEKETRKKVLSTFKTCIALGSQEVTHVDSSDNDEEEYETRPGKAKRTRSTDGEILVCHRDVWQWDCVSEECLL